MQTDADIRGVGVENRGKIADVLYKSEHHSTQPILIFNKENPHNLKSSNVLRRGLDYIALDFHALTVSMRKFVNTLKHYISVNSFM